MTRGTPDGDLPEERTEARSYIELFGDAIGRHSTGLAVAGFLFFLFCSVVGVLTLIHVQFVELQHIAAVEKEQGETIAEQVYLPGLYFNIFLYVAATCGCAYWAVTPE